MIILKDSLVRITDFGEVYDTYSDFYKTHATKDCYPYWNGYDIGNDTSVDYNATHRVMAYGLHRNYRIGREQVVYILNIESKRCSILINKLGIELAQAPIPKFTGDECRSLWELTIKPKDDKWTSTIATISRYGVTEKVEIPRPSNQYSIKDAVYAALKELYHDDADADVDSHKLVREVVRSAKIGEYIQVVDAERPTGYKPGYETGDILLAGKPITRISGSIFAHHLDSDNMEQCRLWHSEYVVLENYLPKQERRHVKRAANTGERIIITNTNTPTVYKNGQEFIVIKPFSTYGIIADVNKAIYPMGFLIYHAEYHVIEG